MVKAYLRYEAAECIGVVSSAASIQYGSQGSTVITAALERIQVWNVRTGELVSRQCPNECDLLTIQACNACYDSKVTKFQLVDGFL